MVTSDGGVFLKNVIKVFLITISFSVILPFLGLNQWKTFAESDLKVDAKSAILVDALSGKIIYSKDIDIPLPPASMTKMMTEYLLLEAISSGKIAWDDIVTASKYAHWMGTHGGSRVYLAEGEKRTVEELMYAMAVYSANDATVALAEYLAGSESTFVEKMNQKAKEFGMTQTYFLTSTGYPANQLEEYSPAITGDHVMSARDSAILALHLLKDYPEILTYTSTPRIKFREEQAKPMDLPNWNWMLPGLVYEYEGVDGLKTGSTKAAGYNFTATAERNGVRFISVIFGTTSEEERFAQTRKLLDYGFVNYETINFLNAKEEVPGNEVIQVEKGKEREVPVITKNNFPILIKKGEQNLYTPIVMIDESINAPIGAGDILGYVTYEYEGANQYGYLSEELQNSDHVALIAKEGVEKAGVFRLFFRKIIDLISGIFIGIVEGIKGVF